MVAIGDSKTYGHFCCSSTNGYRDELLVNLSAALPTRGAQWLGVGILGWPTATARDSIDAFLATMNEVTYTPEWVLINLGSNDFSLVRTGALLEADWKEDTAYILDAIHAKWPDAQIRLMRAYWQGEDIGMTAVNDNWMPSVLSTRAAFAAVGPDERTFLSYPGPTMTDATHPSAVGYSLTAAEWQTTMGY